MEQKNNDQVKTPKQESREEKRHNFFSLLEDRLIDFGKTALKNGANTFIANKIEEAEQKIEYEIKKKISMFQNSVLQFVFLVLGSLFLGYGLFMLLMKELAMVEYSQIVFGGLLLVCFLFLKLKK